MHIISARGVRVNIQKTAKDVFRRRKTAKDVFRRRTVFRRLLGRKTAFAGQKTISAGERRWLTELY